MELWARIKQFSLSAIKEALDLQLFSCRFAVVFQLRATTKLQSCKTTAKLKNNCKTLRPDLRLGRRAEAAPSEAAPSGRLDERLPSPKGSFILDLFSLLLSAASFRLAIFRHFSPANHCSTLHPEHRFSFGQNFRSPSQRQSKCRQMHPDCKLQTKSCMLQAGPPHTLFHLQAPTSVRACRRAGQSTIDASGQRSLFFFCHSFSDEVTLVYESQRKTHTL